MFIFLFGLLIIFFLLVQTTLLPINLAFLALLVFSFFREDLLVGVWLTFLSLLLALFTSLSWAGVLVAYTVTFGLLRLMATLFPKNNLAKVLSLIVAVPLSEVSLLYFTHLLR